LGLDGCQHPQYGWLVSKLSVNRFWQERMSQKRSKQEETQEETTIKVDVPPSLWNEVMDLIERHKKGGS